ncbi:MAG: TlpA disulfide reductase family protein [Planctomycetaceae bacterium]
MTRRVQAIRTDGIRLTVLARRLSNGLLIGQNDVLGECRTDVQQADQLVIGAEIERSAAKLAYARWKLHHAPEPKFVQEESGELPSGTDSPLVGRPALDFTLPFLDGSEFKLSESRGKVVVLDFWATWCGPCLQAMPQVEQVVAEFPESEIQLAAVNLEESAKQVTATLARHQLKAPVVLDQDGIVARKYAASVIPQTVIIDRQGDVVRVFVGGGPDLADQLREALKAVLQPPTVNAAPADAAPPGDDLNLDMTP